MSSWNSSCRSWELQLRSGWEGGGGGGGGAGVEGGVGVGVVVVGWGGGGGPLSGDCIGM